MADVPPPGPGEPPYEPPGPYQPAGPYDPNQPVVAPGPRVVYVEGYPGWLWVDGQYYWSGAQWAWVDGYWIRDRPGYDWSPGYYHPYTHVWIAGSWGPRGYYGGYHRTYDSSPYRGTYSGGSSTSGGGHRNIRTWRHR